MRSPRQRTSPSTGVSRPQRIRKRLVLPLPFGPVRLTNVPGENENDRSLKILRSPRTHPSLLTSSIASHPPIELRSLYWSLNRNALWSAPNRRRFVIWDACLFGAACRGPGNNKAMPGHRTPRSAFGSGFDGAVNLEPVLPTTLKRSHTFEAII